MAITILTHFSQKFSEMNSDCKKIQYKLAIFASGSGTNAENIIRYFSNMKGIEISLIFTNNPNAGVIERAKKYQVPIHIFTKNDLYQNSKVKKILQNHKIDYIILAGFLWLIPEDILSLYPEKIVNIHPALLPKYGGKGMFGNKVHQAVKSNEEIESGITIHYVNQNYDEGDIIFQAKCKIDPRSDSVEEIAKKIHELEYQYYPKIIKKLLNKKC